MRSQCHTELLVKVNAWVDQNVAPLVEVLNELDSVVTLESCESGDDGWAWVRFTTHSPRALRSTVEAVAASLCGLDLPTAVSIEWWYGGTTPSALLKCAPDAIRDTADAIRPSVLAVGARPRSQAGRKGSPSV
jgi:hypothetical protein